MRSTLYRASRCNQPNGFGCVRHVTGGESDDRRGEGGEPNTAAFARRQGCAEHTHWLLQRGARSLAHVPGSRCHQHTAGSVSSATHEESGGSDSCLGNAKTKGGETMNADLILELVEVAISFAQTHLEGEDLDNLLLDIVHKGAEAFHDNSVLDLDLSVINAELPL